MEVDIRKIRCGGWDSSHINVKVNGRWRYLYQPNNLKPINVREPIDFTGGYKPPLPAPGIARLIQSQQLVNQNNSRMSIPITGSTLVGSKVDNFHPTRKRFLMTSSMNRPKAPYTFYPQDKKVKQTLNNRISRNINQDDFNTEQNQDLNNNYFAPTSNYKLAGFPCPPVMTNENFQRFHEQSQKKVRIRRKSFNSYLDQDTNNEVIDDAYSDISDLSMTQSSFSKALCQNSLSSTAPVSNISNDEDFNNEEDSLYFLTAAQPQKAINLASSSPPRKLNSDITTTDIKRPKEKRNPSINGHSKPLMKFKCMVRPQVDSGFKGDTSKLEGIYVESNLPDDVKNYFIEARERQKQLQQEYSDYQYYQDYQNYTY